MRSQDERDTEHGSAAHSTMLTESYIHSLIVPMRLHNAPVGAKKADRFGCAPQRRPSAAKHLKTCGNLRKPMALCQEFWLGSTSPPPCSF